MENQCDIGMVGLGTMGRNLLLNMVDHGATVAGLDTSQSQADLLIQSAPPGKAFGTTDPKQFVAALKVPKAVMILVPAGAPVDSVIDELVPLLKAGDILIDGGNSYFRDTAARVARLSPSGIEFLGIGISGGESGARHGPSMMAGGTPHAYDRVAPFLSSVAAEYEGEPCVALVGPGAAGHYVKMVHNGIEYGLMQLIAEAYDMMRRGLGMSNEECSKVFRRWGSEDLRGFLVEITAEVLVKREDGQYLVDLISDKAKQKGTGKWTSQDALDLGIPVPTIDAAVTAREVSSQKDLRGRLASELENRTATIPRRDLVLTQLQGALHSAFVLTYLQGFSQLSAASVEYNFGIDNTQVAKIWRAGCIIRSQILEQFAEASRFDMASACDSNEIEQLRQVVVAATQAHMPVPCLSASLSYFDGMTSSRLPANLIQAQRDYFGAHCYERIDKAGSFHTPDWSTHA